MQLAAVEEDGLDKDLPEKFLKKWRKYVLCNCWHCGEGELMAMWEKYHIRNSGIAIKTSMENLQNSLSNEFDVFIGKIKYYRDDEHELHYLRDLIFGNIPPELKPEMLMHYPYFFKRKAFEYEHEVRLIIDSVLLAVNYVDSRRIPVDINTEFPDIWKIGTPFKINLETLIGKTGEIIISPYAEKWVTETVESVVRQYGFKFPVSRSRLLDPPN